MGPCDRQGESSRRSRGRSLTITPTRTQGSGAKEDKWPISDARVEKNGIVGTASHSSFTFTPGMSPSVVRATRRVPVASIVGRSWSEGSRSHLSRCLHNIFHPPSRNASASHRKRLPRCHHAGPALSLCPQTQPAFRSDQPPRCRQTSSALRHTFVSVRTHLSSRASAPSPSRALLRR